MVPHRILGPLMLMLSLCDADSMCPDDENPLSLIPPEVVGAYGEFVLVNCTSTEDFPDEMSWKLGNEILGQNFDKSFILQNMQLLDWNVTAECMIKVSESLECSKELEITVYKTPDNVSISALSEDPMVEGTEYQLICEIIDVAPVKNLSVSWYRGGELVKTEHFPDTGVFPVDVYSTLKVTPKRDDNGTQFKCVAKLHLGPIGPEPAPNATSEPYTAVVLYKPLIQACPHFYTGVEHLFTLDMLPCHADGNPQPSVQWFYQGEPINSSEPLNRTHSGKYTAEFENIVGRSNTSVDITIQYGPSFTCNDHYEVQEGSKFQTECEPQGIPQPVTTWFKNGKEMTTPQHWRKNDSGNYLLMATNEHGTANYTLDVDVLYAPTFKSDTGDVFVHEGANVTLTCEADGNPPPDFHWTWTGMNIRDDTYSIDITDVTINAIYSCTASNHLGNITKQIHVQVIETASAADPAVMTTAKKSAQSGCPLIFSPSEVVVRFGDRVSINCSTSATDVTGMGWEATVGGTGLKPLSAVTWTVEKLTEWKAEPICFLNRKNNPQCNAIQTVTLYKTPDNVSISALSEDPMVEGTEYLLICEIIDVAPVKNLRVSWYRGGELVKTEHFSDTGVFPIDVHSILRGTPERDDNGTQFRCVAELLLGPNGPEPAPNATSEPYTAVVLYKPLIQACPHLYTGVEHLFMLDKLSCHADGNPRPRVQWFYQGEPINSSEPLNRTHSGKYTAEFENIVGRSNTSVDITIQYGPSFICNDRYEVQEGSKFQTECEPQGIPQPVTTWFKNGKEMTTPQHWRKNDSGNYLLMATNEHGTASYTLDVDVLYAPVFSEGNYTKEVTLDENVTFQCFAEGNPAPVIRWTYTSAVNVIEATRGRHKYINITGATSTNEGVYICVATNKVGSVTRSVTLTLKGKTILDHLRDMLSWLIPLIILICIIVIVLILYYDRKKHGRYTFVPDKPIPLTPVSGGEQA